MEETEELGADAALGESAYEIGAIQEEAEGEDDEDEAAARAPSLAESNMRPLVTVSGEVSDWVECVNADGDAFYCNLVSHETSWTPPFELLPVDHSARAEPLLSFPSEPPTGGEDASATGRFVKRVLEGSLRRLDPHTQMQLEEARRRHKEMEELRDEEVLMGGEHWIEMYDPTHDGFYYYGVQSGEMRWDRPDSYVMKVESDDVLRMVVRMQCAFRMKLARRRVFQLKLQRGSEDEAATNPWVEVYDPFHKVLYYYCATTGETRWDPPEHFITASEDREMAAAIAIQSMSRSHLARRDVKKRKATIRKKQQEQAMEEARRLREIRRREYSAKTDQERESMSRREMLEEETEQIREGDLYWGIDRHDQEVMRQQLEEKMLADAEAFWQRVNLTLRLRVEMELQRSQEDEAQRIELERINEANESDRMREAEDDQCRLGDCFWGIQAEEKSEERAREAMDEEQEISRAFGAMVNIEDQFRDWADERERNIEMDKVNKIVNEKKYQRQYFKWFYHKCKTADDVLDYLWPTHKRFDPNEDQDSTFHDENAPNNLEEARERGEGAQLKSLPVSEPYVLDDIILRERLETEYRYGGKSIYTIHDPSIARVHRRRGQYVVTSVDTESVFVAAAKKAETKPRPTSPTRPMPASSKPIPNDTESDEEERIRFGMFPALHYRHSKVPDPHLPARYNGVPYRQSEISPTREILLGHHTKRTQLPSLHRHVPPHKAKKSPLSSPTAKTKKQMKHSSFFLGMQTSNNSIVDPLTSSLGFASPFYRQAQAARQQSLQKLVEKRETPEERQAREALEKAQRVRRQFASRFEKEELAVVRELFLMMDLDGSGTINKSEMVWAMQRDGEVLALAKRSALLRLLLKQQSHLEELFRHLRMSDTQCEEISWDIFRIFCEEMYINLMQQGLLDDALLQSGKPPRTTATRRPLQTIAEDTNPKRPTFVERNEEQLIRQVFGMCDQDGDGVLEIEELQRALYTASTPELQRLVRASKALQPLLHQDAFIDAFRKFEPQDSRGISEEEFVVFCMEIANIAILNGML